MKSILIGTAVVLGALGLQTTARAQSDPQLNILSTAVSVPVGSTANILVQVCNNGPSTAIAANKLRPQISTGSSALQIMGITNTNGSPATDFTVLNLTNGNVRVQYIPALAVGSCVEYYVVVKGLAVSAGLGEPIAGALLYNGPQPPGNNNGNDGSSTTILVTVPLPVRMLGFSGRASGCAAELSWQTATEQNSDYYEVQYSGDGHTFRALDKVKSRNSATGSAYSYSFNGLTSGAGNYFRLRIVDLDGSAGYSSTISLAGQCKAWAAASISVSPNPATDVLNIQGLGAGGAMLTVLDLSGREVGRLQAPGDGAQLSLGGLSSGVYVLRVSDARGAEVRNIRVVKR